MKRILCALCVSLLGWQALAGEVDDSLKKFEAALQQSGKEQEKRQAYPGDRQKIDQAIEGRLPYLRECISANNLNDAIETLRQTRSELPEESRKGATELLVVLRKDQETRDKAEVEQFNHSLKHAAETVKTAKNASEFDAILQELSTYKKQGENRNYSQEESRHYVAVFQNWRNVRSKVEETYKFVASWQEYLIAKAAGYEDKARELARALADAPTRLLPRSELLAKAYEPKNLDAKQITEVRPIEKSEGAAQSWQMVLTLDQDGMVSDGKSTPMGVEKLQAAIAPIKASNPDLAIIILTDRHVATAKIRKVRDALNRAGVTKTAFVSDAPVAPKVDLATPSPSPSPSK